jgi:VanZ family protein
MLNTPSPSPRSRSKRAQTLTAWVPPVAWAVLIFIFSSLPGSTIPSPFFSADKVFHLGVYAVLGYLVARALGYYRRARRFVMVLSAIICFLYALSDEFHQSFVPDRTPSFMDVTADTVGSLIGFFICSRKR